LVAKNEAASPGIVEGLKQLIAENEEATPGLFEKLQQERDAQKAKNVGGMAKNT
jgi:hypothetical protein